uniref:Uncharacterized protein n=1 Tax=Anopheles atroparvus TaxID=41427 RepID=A0A182JA58_ANOAO
MKEKEKSIERVITAMANVTKKCDDLSERFSGMEAAKKKKTAAPTPAVEDAAALKEVAELQALRAPLYGENKAGDAKGHPAQKAPTEKPPQRCEEWSIVENAKKKKYAAKQLQKSQQQQQQPPKKTNSGKSSKKRPQNPAILLQGEKPEEIMAALKEARKEKEFDEQLRPHVEGLRSAIRSSGVVIELKMGTENLEALNKALSNAVGDKATAKSVTPQEELCCTGVEAFYTAEEFCVDVEKQLNLTLEPSRVRMRPSRDGRQVAAFLVNLHRVEELLTKKINVGWTANIAIQRSSWKPRCQKLLKSAQSEWEVLKHDNSSRRRYRVEKNPGACAVGAMSSAKRPAGPSPSGPSDSDAERNIAPKNLPKKKTKKSTKVASGTDGEPNVAQFLKNRHDATMDDESDAPTTKRDARKEKAKKPTEENGESDAEALIEKIQATVAETKDKDTRRFLKRLIRHERDSAALKARFAAMEITMKEKEKSIERVITAMANVTKKCDDLLRLERRTPKM